MSALDELAARVGILEKKVAQLEASHAEPAQPRATKDQKGLTVKEFILNKRPSNDVEKTLAIGYFLEKFEAAASFNTDDLARNFVLAKEATPTNINDKVNLNIKKGHMAEAREKKDKKKAWMVTNSGERFVESGFDSKRD